MKFICKKCGSSEYKIIEKSNGNGIATGLYCAKCGQWQKWLNKQEKVLFANDINSMAETENPKAKSLRWVANQIPDFEPETVDDKMLLAIKRYATAGATEIERLEAENAELKARLENAVELKAKVGDVIYMPWIYVGRVTVSTLLIIGLNFYEGEFIYITNLESDSPYYLEKYKYGIFRNKDFNSIVFTNRTEAEKRLAELQEEKE